MWTSCDNKSKVFLSGIGGVGVSAIAIYLKELGFSVSGSDERESVFTKRLIEKGINVFYGHDEKNLEGRCDVFIYSQAIKEDNPELLYAKKHKIPVFSRAEVLSAISKKYPVSIGVCGAHGKTTTTALIANILYFSDVRFSAFIGGDDKNLTNACNFGNDIFLGEICEYEKNIDKFKCDVGVILNIDNDHLECFKDFSDLISSFYAFYDRSYIRIVNKDDAVLSGFDKEQTTFGESADFAFANVRTKNMRLKFDVLKNGKRFIKADVALVGAHHVYNLLAAVAVADKLGVSKKAIEKGLKNFRGVARRNEEIGIINGAKVFADYAHHPSEIKKELDYYSSVNTKRLFVVFQPHTYSRTKNLFDEFKDAFKSVERLKIFSTYPAREAFDENGSAEKLAESLKNAKYYDDFDKMIDDISNEIKKGDILLVLGAGDIYDKFVSFFKQKLTR